MSDHIKLRNAPGKYSVRASGAILGESSDVIELSEDGHEPVLYVPRADVAMVFFDQSDHKTHCPHKGGATYFTLQANSGPVKNTAWSYDAPIDDLEPITGHIAFRDGVTVEPA